MPGFSADDVARVDASGQLADVLALPAQLEDALWRVESSGVERALERLDGLTPLLVCGMGGSAIGSDLAVDLLNDTLTRPLHTIRGYELPSWATPDSVVVCASYSGDTEEALACFEAAEALGAARVAVTAGGRLAELARTQDVPVIPLPGVLPAPRLAVGYMLVAVLEVAAHAGVAPGMRAEIDAASAHLEALAGEWGPDADPDSLAKRVARRVHGSCVCVYGAAPTASVARRWKTQINENAKVPSFYAELPEADHNEIVGWDGASDVGKFTGVFLEDADQHPRVRRRIELTAKAIESHAADALLVESRGTNRVERILSLVMLGDLVSIYMAALQGIDPTPVEAIDALKAAMGH
ncbi:MAG: bifunctional phosphoglucose/phosphomannose isomerase [Solirubrobacterales bacterium]